jgi:toxin ParE1/3/4
MSVNWASRAARDLYHIGLYIRGDSPEASVRVVRTIFDECQNLATSPDRGRIGKRPGTRELVFAPLPYIAVYRVTARGVDILSIWHGAQNR